MANNMIGINANAIPIHRTEGFEEPLNPRINVSARMEIPIVAASRFNNPIKQRAIAINCNSEVAKIDPSASLSGVFSFGSHLCIQP